MWYKYKEGFLCSNCHSKLISNKNRNPETVKKWNTINNKKWHPRRLLFKGKSITLKENPRQGICQQCKRVIGNGIKRTNIHHIEYHDNNPLKDTIELCPSCHNKQHIKRRGIKGQFI